MKPSRDPIRPDRVRSIPQSFSWIDREILHRQILHRLAHEELILYFFLVLVSGPEGTSFWSYKSIAGILRLTVDEVIEATRGLIKGDLVAFRFPIFQVLSLPQREDAP